MSARPPVVPSGLRAQRRNRVGVGRRLDRVAARLSQAPTAAQQFVQLLALPSACVTCLGT